MPSEAKDTAYSGTPLPKKLGLITAKAAPLQVATVGMPPGFVESLGELPANVGFRLDHPAKDASQAGFQRG